MPPIVLYREMYVLLYTITTVCTVRTSEAPRDEIMKYDDAIVSIDDKNRTRFCPPLEQPSANESTKLKINPALQTADLLSSVRFAFFDSVYTATIYGGKKIIRILTHIIVLATGIEENNAKHHE